MRISYLAEPKSREDLRKLAYSIRKAAGYENELYFPIMRFLEEIMPLLMEDYHLEVEPAAQLGSKHGKTDSEKHVITLREDVYYGAVNDKGRDRFTAAHELYHCIGHPPGAVTLYRIPDDENIPCFIDPEWQADCFAGELLIPHHLIQGKPPEDIARTCKTSLQAARCQSKYIQPSTVHTYRQ
jgi:Zn-dependent peptidase ImmA (M78 family)